MNTIDCECVSYADGHHHLYFRHNGNVFKWIRREKYTELNQPLHLLVVNGHNGDALSYVHVNRCSESTLQKVVELYRKVCVGHLQSQEETGRRAM
jgi:hypothetical protein